MKKVVNGIAILSLVAIMTACGNQNEVVKTAAAPPVVKQPAKAEVKEAVKEPVKNKFEIQREKDLEKFNAYVAVMMDSKSFVKSATWEKGSARIEFLDYSEYKGELSEAEFNAAWITHDRARTILMEWPLLLFKEFPDMLTVQMTTPLIGGKKLFFGTLRDKAEEIYGFTFKSLEEDRTGLWKRIATTLFTKENRDYMEQNHFRDLVKNPFKQ